MRTTSHLQLQLTLSPEMVEPLEDTRSELIFATEPVISSLAISIPGSPSSRQSTVELDEIEVRTHSSICRTEHFLMGFQIQKGILQLCKGLVFLHTSARMIHSNLDPESVIINSAVRCRFPLHVIRKLT
jgi:SCY1-like protein 2